MSERSFDVPYADKDSATSSEGSFEKHVEGGRRAWLTVLGSFLIYYSSFGMLNSFGFFQAFYQQEYLANVASPSTISFIGTIQLALMNGLSTISGAICDAQGIRVRLWTTTVHHNTDKSNSICTCSRVQAQRLHSFFYPSAPRTHCGRYFLCKVSSWESLSASDFSQP